MQFWCQKSVFNGLINSICVRTATVCARFYILPITFAHLNLRGPVQRVLLINHHF